MSAPEKYADGGAGADNVHHFPAAAFAFAGDAGGQTPAV